MLSEYNRIVRIAHLGLCTSKSAAQTRSGIPRWRSWQWTRRTSLAILEGMIRPQAIAEMPAYTCSSHQDVGGVIAGWRGRRGGWVGFGELVRFARAAEVWSPLWAKTIPAPRGNPYIISALPWRLFISLIITSMKSFYRWYINIHCTAIFMSLFCFFLFNLRAEDSPRAAMPSSTSTIRYDATNTSQRTVGMHLLPSVT